LKRIITACSALQKVLFLGAVSLFVYEISPEPLNGFVPNSHGTRVWSLTRTSLKVEVTKDKSSIFRPFRWCACSLCLV